MKYNNKKLEQELVDARYLLFKEQRQIFLTDNGALKTMKYEGIMRTKIWNQLARLKFMLDFYLRNYNV